MESILLTGDIMPGRLAEEHLKISEEIIKYFSTASLRVCNLEGVITQQTPLIHEVKDKPKKYLCKHGITTEQASILKKLYIDCCNLANNHILDYGMDAVKDTIQFLNAADIKWFGFGKNWDTAWKPRIVKIKDCTDIGLSNGKQEKSSIRKKTIFKIAIFGLADHFVEWKADNDPGINYFTIDEFLTPDMNPNRQKWTNIEIIKSQIDKVRDTVDLIIFSIHWGNNFQKKVSSTIQEFAHVLIDMGVNIIHGHSTHHVQGVEVYKGNLILYGCGEFLNDYDIFDEFLALKNETLGDDYIKFRSDLGFLYKVFLKGSKTTKCLKVDKLELLPIQIKQASVERCNNENESVLFNRMFEACKQLGTDIMIEDNMLVVTVT